MPTSTRQISSPVARCRELLTKGFKLFGRDLGTGALVTTATKWLLPRRTTTVRVMRYVAGVPRYLQCAVTFAHGSSLSPLKRNCEVLYVEVHDP